MLLLMVNNYRVLMYKGYIRGRGYVCVFNIRKCGDSLFKYGCGR